MTLPNSFGLKFIIELINECWKEDPHETPPLRLKIKLVKYNYFIWARFD